MAHGRYYWMKFSIANGAAASAPVDIGPTGILVGILIDGMWTAAKLSFAGYVLGTGLNTAIGVDNAWQDTTSASPAVYDQVKDINGNAVLVGNGTDISKQFLTWADTLFAGLRWLQVLSRTAANAAQNQGQAVTGYLLVRDLR